MRIIICGLAVTSSWGNGHATTYRSLIKALSERGHRILFLERHQEWYSIHRDLSDSPYFDLEVYHTIEELKDRFSEDIRTADVVIVGSYLKNGIEIGEYVIKTSKGLSVFYDLDTPVTLEKFKSKQENHYINQKLVSQFDLYLSFTGGPILKILEQHYRSPRAKALFCSVDPNEYYPDDSPKKWDLGYLGTFSDDRQKNVDKYLTEVSRLWETGHFVICGSQYPVSIRSKWPENLSYFSHLSPNQHRQFYNQQRYTLNVTRSAMICSGHSPSIRIFEAASCGVPILSDYWPGLDQIFTPDEEIFIVRNQKEVLKILKDTPEEIRIQVGNRARMRVLAEYTSTHRAVDFENHVRERQDELAKVSCY